MDCKVSILMSIFNESRDEMQDSIESILNQTFSEFELIIVIDDPLRNDIYSFLQDTYGYENRIRIYKNIENIGLAMSMNKAASLAKANIYARMDADDICEPTRIQEQYSYMRKYKCDLCCTSFVYIDEFGTILGRKVKQYTDESLLKFLPYFNTIHHPTVMMTQNIFECVGGYRDFPCSQDYDLWLRIIEKNAVVHLIDKPLLRYRIRENSVSQSKMVKQYFTIQYIRKLYKERKNNNIDSYSKENYVKYLKKNKVFDKIFLEKTQKYKLIKDKIDMYRGNPKKKVERVAMIIELFCLSNFYRRYYLSIIFDKVEMKFLKHIER